MIPAIYMYAIVWASMISILSVGWTMTHLTAKIPNFAHGAYAAIGVYVSFTLCRIHGYSPYLGLPLAALLGGLTGLFLYIVIVNTIVKMGGGAIVLTVATIAIGIFLRAGMNVYATWIRMATGNYAYNFMLKESDFTFLGYNGVFFVSLGACISTAVLLHILLTRTKIGVAMRATAEDPELASVVGINTQRVQQFSWFITGAMAAVAGALMPLWFMSTPAIGLVLLSACMAGSLLGGVESCYGAILGGFVVGFAQIVITRWLMGWFGAGVGEYRPMVPMIILIIVLLVEPRGIVGLIDRLRASPRFKGIISRFER